MKPSVAIVTGASSGIGLEVARKLVARGWSVALVARTASKLEALARELGNGCKAFPLDVSDLRACAVLPRRVVAEMGRLDLLVNNAGANHRGPVEKVAPDALTEILTTNLSAPVVLSRAALDHLGTGGAIVNVASLAGYIPVPDEATYSASKAGLRFFSRALAVEVGARGVHVAVVCPGPVDTPFFGDVEHVPPIVFSQPMSTAAEVADAVLRAVDERLVEIAIPAQSGRLATLGYVFPGLATMLRPSLERRGEKKRAAYIRDIREKGR